MRSKRRYLLLAFAALAPAAGAAQSIAHTAVKVTERVLYRFEGGADGAHPEGGVVMDSADNLYGTTYGTMVSGVNDCAQCGTVFEISRKSHAETILHRFSGGTSDGANPTAGVSIDSAGNLYGTTEFGGTGCITNYLIGCGTVFEISSKSHLETILKSFSAAGGWAPDGGLIFDRAGNLYGTTTSGTCGYRSYGCGTVFEIAGGTRKETVVDTFERGGNIVGFPKGRLVMDRSGNLYGTTWDTGGHVSGVLFEIVAGTHEPEVLHMFAGSPDGGTPNGNLVIDSRGDLFGTTHWGGGFCYIGSIDAMGCGTVFEIHAGTHKETILYRFQGGSDGMEPRGGLVMDNSGDLYGTTYSGGLNCRFGCGTVFEIAAGNHKESVLYRFRGGQDGSSPEGELFMDSAGNLYGTTFGGGTDCGRATELGPGCGTAFEIIRN